MALQSGSVTLTSVNLSANPAKRGLLITADPQFARAFRRELKRSGNIIPLDIYPSLEEATSRAEERYDWITVDLDRSVAPSDAVRVARWSWPGARVAIVSYWWAERDPANEAWADLVIHKPVRAAELEALLATSTRVLAPAQPVRPQLHAVS